MSDQERSQNLVRRPDDRPAPARRRRRCLRPWRRWSGLARRSLAPRDPVVLPPDATPIPSQDELRRREETMQQDLLYRAAKLELRRIEEHHVEDIEDRRQARRRREGLILVEKVRAWIGTGRRAVWLVVAVAIAMGAIVALAGGFDPTDLLKLLQR